MTSEKEIKVHALVLAGGRGTRSENPLMPKILQSISDEQKLIDLHFTNLIHQDPLDDVIAAMFPS